MSRLEQIKKKKVQPVYSRTKEEKQPTFKNYFLIFTLLLLFVVTVYLIVFSKAFQIKEIEVTGYSHPETIKSLVGEQTEKNIFTKNILFFNIKDLKETLLGDPNIYETNIIKKYPSKIIIEITESQPAIIWNSAGDKLLVDDRGVVMNFSENENLPEVNDASNIKVKPGERVASPTFIKFINDINRSFEASTGTKIVRITIFDLLTDVHILTADGWTVYADASKSSDGQLKNLTKVLEEAKKDSKKLQYVDMRLDNKIFYK